MPGQREDNLLEIKSISMLLCYCAIIVSSMDLKPEITSIHNSSFWPFHYITYLRLEIKHAFREIVHKNILVVSVQLA